MLFTIAGNSAIRRRPRKIILQYSSPNLIGLGNHLFLKVPRPGDSEVTFSVFESSCYLLLPV